MGGDAHAEQQIVSWHVRAGTCAQPILRLVIAKQAIRATRAALWIASSAFGLLAMTSRIAPLPPQRELALDEPRMEPTARGRARGTNYRQARCPADYWRSTDVVRAGPRCRVHRCVADAVRPIPGRGQLDAIGHRGDLFLPRR